MDGKCNPSFQNIWMEYGMKTVGAQIFNAVLFMENDFP